MFFFFFFIYFFYGNQNETLCSNVGMTESPCEANWEI